MHATYLTLAEAVTTIAYRRELTSAKLWERRRQRHRGRFPTYIQKRLDDAGNMVLKMIR